MELVLQNVPRGVANQRKVQEVQGSNLQAAKAQDSVRQVGGQDGLGHAAGADWPLDTNREPNLGRTSGLTQGVTLSPHLVSFTCDHSAGSSKL